MFLARAECVVSQLVLREGSMDIILLRSTGGEVVIKDVGPQLPTDLHVGYRLSVTLKTL
jgi:hypothetical protein